MKHDGGGGVDGDGSGGQSLSRQGAGTGPSDPRNLVSMVAARRNFSWKMIDSFRVFASGGINRPKYDGQSRPWAPHHVPARPEVGPLHHMVWRGRGSPPSPLSTLCTCWENRRLSFRPVQFREYVLCNFSETKNSRKHATGTWHLVNRLVQ